MSFENKTAIVTGAGQGIGFEICRQLAKEGAYVLLNDLDETLAVNAAKVILEQTGGKCIALAGDSGDINFIQQMVDVAVDKIGHLDIVIANAGITLFGDFFNYKPEAFSRVMQVNLGGTFFLAQALYIAARTRHVTISLPGDPKLHGIWNSCAVRRSARLCC